MSPEKKTGSTDRAPLTKDRVIQAAVALADTEGVAKLTMRKLAAALGVEAMSLYYHFSNKAKILDAMVDAIFGEVDLPADDDEWKPAMRERARSLRSVMLKHTWAVGIMDSRPDPGMATLRHHDSVIGCLRAAGFSMALTAHAFSAIDAYIYGFVLQETALPFETSEELADVAGNVMELLPADQFPHFSSMVAEYYMRPDYSFADEFDIGLELLLDGIERLHAGE